MIEKKYIKLIHKEIDASLTPEEQKELRAYLKKNPEAQKLYDELLYTSNLLNTIPEVEPPPNLQKRILNSIDIQRYRRIPGGSIWKSLLSPGLLTPRPKMAFAFAIGLIIGLLIPLIFLLNQTQKQVIDLKDLYGTIGIIQEVEVQPLELLSINYPEITGNIAINYYKNLVWFDLNLRTKHAHEISFEFSRAQTQFQGLKPFASPRITLESQGNSVKISSTGDTRSILFFSKTSKEPASVTITLKIPERVDFRRQIILQPPPD